MAAATSGVPERKSSTVTIDEIESARKKLVEAALVFDAIEDGDEEVNWREGFGLLRDAAQALGNLNTLKHLGIG